MKAPDSYLPLRDLLERDDSENTSLGMQKVTGPTLEMPNPYGVYDNSGSMASQTPQEFSQGQLPGWLEKVAKFLEPASRAQEETGGGLGLVIPPDSFNMFNQTPVESEPVYVDSRPKHGTFSEEWLRDNPPPPVKDSSTWGNTAESPEQVKIEGLAPQGSTYERYNYVFGKVKRNMTLWKKPGVI